MPRNPSPAESLDPTQPQSPSLSEPTTPPTSPLFSNPTSPPDLGPSSESHDEPQSSESDAGSVSPRPSISKTAAAARRRELRKVTEAFIGTIGGLLNDLLARGPERDAGLYLPDEDDVEAISDPLAGLASRRMPEGAENPDITDLIRLGFGLLGYAVKQRVLKMQLAYVPEAPAEDPASEPAPAWQGDEE